MFQVPCQEHSAENRMQNAERSDFVVYGRKRNLIDTPTRKLSPFRACFPAADSWIRRRFFLFLSWINAIRNDNWTIGLISQKTCLQSDSFITKFDFLCVSREHKKLQLNLILRK